MIETIVDPYGKAAFPTVVKCDGCGKVIKHSGTMASETEHFCDECSTPANQEFRICDHCGKPMVDGMTDLCDFYCHEKCFERAMDARYPDGWRINPSGDEGPCGGYYDSLYKPDGSWNDTGIFYTTWY